ncbi:RES family NAD+ phosphorylase [Hyphomicrobium sp. CS1BSMeth3]|uniref:RES family NAD+ phosphorylase n=1 Tax=Hyphomicrobium sp. CS1BSMeth3 TaxID=1892844 RepID=UPI0009305827|nr:RES family NAD+ phosphorylase [Hyphomicrobium sp. CS1BSMeth3]
MLESLARVAASHQILRLANLTHVAAFAAKKGLTIDEVTDVIAFERDDVTKELIESPFQRKAVLGNKFAPSSRFSDGEWPVFYAAIERDTAEKESSHHYGRKAAGDATAQRPVHYSLVRCTFEGEVIDLVAKLGDWPELVSEDYTFCNGLGKEAWDMGLGAFLAPSARRPGGTTVPAFVAKALSNPVIVSTVTLSYDNGGTVVEYKSLPAS